MHGAVLLLLLAANDHRAPGPQVAVRFTIVPPRTVVADMWGTHGVSATLGWMLNVPGTLVICSLKAISRSRATEVGTSAVSTSGPPRYGVHTPPIE